MTPNDQRSTASADDRVRPRPENVFAGPVVATQMRWMLGLEFAGRSFGKLRGAPVLLTSLNGCTFGTGSPAASSTPSTATSGSPTSSRHMRVGSSSTGALVSEGVKNHQICRAPSRGWDPYTPLISEEPV